MSKESLSIYISFFALLVSLYTIFNSRRRLSLSFHQYDEKKYSLLSYENTYNPYYDKDLSKCCQDPLSKQNVPQGYYIVEVLLLNNSPNAITIDGLGVFYSDDKVLPLLSLNEFNLVNNYKVPADKIDIWTKSDENSNYFLHKIDLYSNDHFKISAYETKIFKYAIAACLLDTLSEKPYLLVGTTVPSFNPTRDFKRYKTTLKIKT